MRSLKRSIFSSTDTGMLLHPDPLAQNIFLARQNNGASSQPKIPFQSSRHSRFSEGHEGESIYYGRISTGPMGDLIPDAICIRVQ